MTILALVVSVDTESAGNALVLSVSAIDLEGVSRALIRSALLSFFADTVSAVTGSLVLSGGMIFLSGKLSLAGFCMVSRIAGSLSLTFAVSVFKGSARSPWLAAAPAAGTAILSSGTNSSFL